MISSDARKDRGTSAKRDMRYRNSLRTQKICYGSKF